METGEHERLQKKWRRETRPDLGAGPSIIVAAFLLVSVYIGYSEFQRWRFNQELQQAAGSLSASISASADYQSIP